MVERPLVYSGSGHDVAEIQVYKFLLKKVFILFFKSKAKMLFIIIYQKETIVSVEKYL